jgi:ATP phosphoribosyltransferase regulatory subunit HisZ
LDRLEGLWDVIELLGLSDSFEIDLGDVSRLDYYTGLTFKIYVNGIGVRVGSGGRYDGLTANFGKDEPAIGFELDLDELTDVLGARSLNDNVARQTFANLSGITDGDPATFFRGVLDRRAKGERVLLDLISI